MRSDLTDITIVLDKSGSMSEIVDDVIGGFNTFVETQAKEPGEALLSLVLFDDTYEFKFIGTPIKEVHKLTRKSYIPCGNTALLDASARAIIETGARLEKMDEKDRPGKVVLVIMTDGRENSSVEHNLEQVRAMIEHQQKAYNWHVVFLGANFDAFQEGQKINIKRVNTMNYGYSGQGVGVAFSSAARGVTRLRGESVIPCSTSYAFFSEEEQKQGEATKAEKSE